MDYPFENKQRRICLLNLSCDVDKEEMIDVVVINSAFLKWDIPCSLYSGNPT